MKILNVAPQRDPGEIRGEDLIMVSSGTRKLFNHNFWLIMRLKCFVWGKGGGTNFAKIKIPDETLIFKQNLRNIN